MASVYRHSRGNTPYWIAVFTDENGKQRHRSTKTKNYTQAVAHANRLQRAASILRARKERAGETGVKNQELILEELVRATQRASEGVFTEHDGRDVVNRLLELSGHRKLDSVTIEKFLTDWAGSKNLSTAPGTARRYKHTVETFLAHLGKKAADSLITLSSRDIETFRNLQIKEGKSATTANMTVKTLRVPLNMARRQGLILTNPAEAVDMLPSDNLTRDPFTLEQLESLLRCADNEWKGMILVGATAGLRLGDVASLTWKNVDLEKRILRYIPEKSRTNKPIETVILPDLEKYLLAICPSGKGGEKAVFPTLGKVPVSGVGGLSARFHKLMSTAGIEPETLRERKKGSRGRTLYNLSFHSLRHTYVSLMANAGVSQELRMKLAGHTSDAHQRYTHIEIETMRGALKGFPRLVR